MGSQSRRAGHIRRGANAAIALLVPLLGTLAFRCPGAEPQASADGGGEGGDGGYLDGAGGLGAGPIGGGGAEGGAGGGCGDTDVDPDNCGACGRECSTVGVDTVSCSAGVCSSTCVSGLSNLSLPPAPAPDDGCEAGGKRVFVTSQALLADFGSATAADSECVTIAMNLGLGGEWLAWISDYESSVIERFVQASVPYRLMDGTIIADDWLDLTNGDLQHAIDQDETGAPASFEVWTGTGSDGNRTDLDCAGWTQPFFKYQADVGQSFVADSAWSTTFLQFCDRDNVHLYCFEQ